MARTTYRRAMNAAAAAHVLGLEHPSVGRDELVGAWRRFARANHPDRCPGDTGAAWRFATGREAFEVLIERKDPAPPPVASYGRTGVVHGADAHRAVPYAMRPLHRREWLA
jgi:DnaJ-class molecular chaperone